MTSLSDAVTMFLDGKVADARIIHKKLNGPAHCVGEDAQGNKYYEIKKGVTYGRHRWVDFANIHDYSPASIPPEWHGWLHNVTDDEPNTVKFIEPSYKVDVKPYKHLAYQPKGSFRHGSKKRNWKKYEAWTPS
eukprot:CAMPEP_0198238438 /NCGR_PEP_ID=MMETSP1446-20131203/4072_1 /TAXON_ID=1461542 ORGANISM="Unidentified sp, Strain CCMP2111" /NCGR_SAMPLE_ID=MMETSP1446 /ASSEMBLY_ACC=CAM_ASM_001112 /LENGTH=132 /DNA_ID=CAMNT_0043920843 /DNA_START=42 /DNA_END=440 /DNA_ORIENTATION=-